MTEPITKQDHESESPNSKFLSDKIQQKYQTINNERCREIENLLGVEQAKRESDRLQFLEDRKKFESRIQQVQNKMLKKELKYKQEREEICKMYLHESDLCEHLKEERISRNLFIKEILNVLRQRNEELQQIKQPKNICSQTETRLGERPSSFKRLEKSAKNKIKSMFFDRATNSKKFPCIQSNNIRKDALPDQTFTLSDHDFEDDGIKKAASHSKLDHPEKDNTNISKTERNVSTPTSSSDFVQQSSNSSVGGRNLSPEIQEQSMISLLQKSPEEEMKSKKSSSIDSIEEIPEVVEKIYILSPIPMAKSVDDVGIGDEGKSVGTDGIHPYYDNRMLNVELEKRNTTFEVLSFSETCLLVKNEPVVDEKTKTAGKCQEKDGWNNMSSSDDVGASEFSLTKQSTPKEDSEKEKSVRYLVKLPKLDRTLENTRKKKKGDEKKDGKQRKKGHIILPKLDQKKTTRKRIISPIQVTENSINFTNTSVNDVGSVGRKTKSRNTVCRSKLKTVYKRETKHFRSRNMILPQISVGEQDFDSAFNGNSKEEVKEGSLTNRSRSTSNRLSNNEQHFMEPIISEPLLTTRRSTKQQSFDTSDSGIAHFPSSGELPVDLNLFVTGRSIK